MEWQSILTGSIQKRACEKIHEIAEIILTMTLSKDDIGLLYGNIGIAIFLFYYSVWSQKQSAYNKASKILAQCIDKVSQKKLMKNVDFSIAKGLSGFGWGINHLLRNDFIEGDIVNFMNTVDAEIYQEMINCVNNDKLDFPGGAIGIGYYCVDRDNRFSREYLRRFIKEMFCKRNVCEKLNDDAVKMLNLLLKIKRKFPDIEFVDKLILNTSEFINKKYCVDFNKEKEKVCFLKNRLIVKLLNAKICGGGYEIDCLNVLGRDEIVDFHRPLLELLVKSFETPAYYAHLLNRCYHTLEEPYLKDLSINAFEYMLDYAPYVEKTTGYKVWLTHSQNICSLHLGIVNGLAGVGLSLITAVSSMIPQWDECVI